MSESTIPGRPLELAIEHAAYAYEKEGRAVWLKRQETPKATTVDGRIIHSHRGAACDFIGGVDGKAWGIECKMIEGSAFPLEPKRKRQRRALARMAKNQIAVHVVIEFEDYGEVYMVAWEAIADFLAAPWRRSLPLYWVRAYGLQLPEKYRGTAKRLTHFLSGFVYPGRAAAQAAVEAERKSKPVIRIDEDEDGGADGAALLLEPPKPAAAAAPRTPEQRRADLEQAFADGCVNAAKRARLGRWGRR